jgi:hypothetical protein
MTITPNSLLVRAPWSLRLGRYGIDNIAIICNRTGHELVRSCEFRCPVTDHDHSETWDSLVLMSIAPELYWMLSATLQALREVQPNHPVCEEAQAILTRVSLTDEEAHLHNCWDIHSELAERKAIASIWDYSDVLTVRPDLTDEQAWEVLQAAKRHHDANIGINWEVLEFHAQFLFGDAPESATGTEG